jgi:Arc/MetJ family transcription regulator
MRVTVEIDDKLLAEAQAASGLRDITALVHEALKALIERERKRRRREGSSRTLIGGAATPGPS